jgi:hypothetical protein
VCGGWMRVRGWWWLDVCACVVVIGCVCVGGGGGWMCVRRGQVEDRGRKLARKMHMRKASSSSRTARLADSLITHLLDYNTVEQVRWWRCRDSIHPLSHTHPHTPTHPHTHTHAHTRTHTHTHAHTPAPRSQICRGATSRRSDW